MIRVDEDEVEVKGNAIILMAEVTTLLAAVTEAIAEELHRPQRDVIDTVIEAIQFGKLRRAGMTKEEALDILGKSIRPSED